MSITPNKEPNRGNTLSEKHSNNSNQKGIVTVRDEKHPTPEERDAQIPKEPGTQRLRSERESVEENKRAK